MNKRTPTADARAALEDQFGRRVAARLTAGNLDMPHEFSERLRAARMQALAQRKLAPQLHSAPVVIGNGRTAILGGWWMRVGAVVPLVALLGGLVVISMVQDDSRTNELAEVDSALLTDALPPAAYTDPGFAQFVQTSAEKSAR